MTQSSRRVVDSYLVGCARLGDRVAQEQLVTRYQKRFLRHAYRPLQESEQARSAVQEGWIEILRGFPKLTADEAFPAWAFRIITRKCARQIAELPKDRKTLAAISLEPTPDNRAGHETDLAANRRSVHKALAGLSSEHRATVAGDHPGTRATLRKPRKSGGDRD